MTDALFAFLLAALAVVGVVVLSLAGQPVPDVLEYAIVGALAGGAGLARPAMGRRRPPAKRAAR